MISDGTGIPPEFARQAGFVQETYGSFQGAMCFDDCPSDEYNDQFRDLWASQPQRKLGFRYGYVDSQKAPTICWSPGAPRLPSMKGASSLVLVHRMGVRMAICSTLPSPLQLGPQPGWRGCHHPGGRWRAPAHRDGARSAHICAPGKITIPAPAGMVIYIHGYFTSVDQTWTDDHLATQFRDSGLNALFIAIEAPQSNDQDVFWKSLEDLLRTVEDRATMAATARTAGGGGAQRGVSDHSPVVA